MRIIKDQNSEVFITYEGKIRRRSRIIRVLLTPYSNRNSYIITNLGWSEEEYLNEGIYITIWKHTKRCVTNIRITWVGLGYYISEMVNHMNINFDMGNIDSGQYITIFKFIIL